MREVLFSFGLLGLFANADAMHLAQKMNVEDQRNLIYSFITGDTICISGSMGELSRMRVRELKRKFTKIYKKCQRIRRIYLAKGSQVCELGDRCLNDLNNLREFIFAKDSNLERIGDVAFCGTHIESLSLPDSVRELGFGCCSKLKSLQQVTFGANSKV